MADEATNLIMEQLHILRRGQDELRRGQEGVQSSVDDMRRDVSISRSACRVWK